MENTLQLGNLLKEGTYPEEYTGGEKWTILHAARNRIEGTGRGEGPTGRDAGK